MGYLREIRKIMKGGLGKISLSQMVMHITNMRLAKRNLSASDFNLVNDLFLSLLEDTKKVVMDLKAYCDVSSSIIFMFNETAPYRFYSGRSLSETNEIVKMAYERQKHIIEDECSDNREENGQLSLFEAEFLYNREEEKKQYADYIVETTQGMIESEYAKEFSEILDVFSKCGKDKCMEEFDKFERKIIASDCIYKTFTMAFFIGALNSNNIIDEEEMNVVREKYVNIMINDG